MGFGNTVLGLQFVVWGIKIGAFMITYTILGVPYCNYSMICNYSTKYPPNPILIIKALYWGSGLGFR